MSLSEDIALMDAMAQAEMIRRKEITPVELVESTINKIESLNPAINAVVTKMYDEARDEAQGNLPDGPFTGVPFLLKDLLASYAGIKMTSGSNFTRDFVPPHDSELVKRYKRAGLIILGKTNTPEFGTLPTTESKLLGPCLNPWDVTKTAGGSSGGSAAAVASGMVPMAHANDGGGSIRIPASCCGLFGMKPTRARNPLGPDFGDMFTGLVAEHALTRSVRDSAALLDATSGPDLGDPYYAPQKARPFIEEVGADPGRLRIAFLTKSLNGARVHEDCIGAVEDAVDLLSDLGHTVEEMSFDIDGNRFADAFTVLWSTGLAWTVDGFAQAVGRKPEESDLEPGNWLFYQVGSRQNAANYLQAVQIIQAMSRHIARMFVDCDVLVTPTLAQPPLPIGSFEPTAEDPLAGMRVSSGFAPFTPLCNMTGQPAMSVPLHWNSEGLPIGVHFIGRFGDEATLFRLAGQMEQARPWVSRRPRVSA
jgi:amidase